MNKRLFIALLFLVFLISTSYAARAFIFLHPQQVFTSAVEAQRCVSPYAYDGSVKKCVASPSCPDGGVLSNGACVVPGLGAVFFTNPNVLDLEGFQVKMDGFDLSLVQSGCEAQNLKFTDPLTGNVIPYWVESTSPAIVWLKVPFIPSQGQKRVDVSCSGGEMNSPEGVFEIYDHFNRSGCGVSIALPQEKWSCLSGCDSDKPCVYPENNGYLVASGMFSYISQHAITFGFYCTSRYDFIRIYKSAPQDVTYQQTQVCPSGYEFVGNQCRRNPVCPAGGTFNSSTAKCEMR